jgi:hypothetical protein
LVYERSHASVVARKQHLRRAMDMSGDCAKFFERVAAVGIQLWVSPCGPVSSVEGLLSQIATTDIVVATRFHGVLLALLCESQLYLSHFIISASP